MEPSRQIRVGYTGSIAVTLNGNFDAFEARNWRAKWLKMAVAAELEFLAF
jgi:hypothetical protein